MKRSLWNYAFRNEFLNEAEEKQFWEASTSCETEFSQKKKTPPQLWSKVHSTRFASPRDAVLSQKKHASAWCNWKQVWPERVINTKTHNEKPCWPIFVTALMVISPKNSFLVLVFLFQWPKTVGRLASHDLLQRSDDCDRGTRSGEASAELWAHWDLVSINLLRFFSFSRSPARDVWGR